MTVWLRRVDVPGPSDCTHERATGELLGDGGYGADDTDAAEAEAESVQKLLRNVDRRLNGSHRAPKLGRPLALQVESGVICGLEESARAGRDADARDGVGKQPR